MARDEYDSPRGLPEIAELALWWVEAWYEGPLRGLATLDGELVYFDAEGVPASQYAVRRLSGDERNEVERRHREYELLVGTHWCFHLLPGDRNAAPRNQRDFRRRHPPTTDVPGTGIATTRRLVCPHARTAFDTDDRGRSEYRQPTPAWARTSGYDVLWRYLVDEPDRELWWLLRTELRWNETSFRQMVQALVAALEATEHDEYVPRALATMFVTKVQSIIAMMHRPDFAARNAAGRSKDEARLYFLRREELLRSLCSWFTSGWLFEPIRERLSLADWEPTFGARQRPVEPLRSHVSADQKLRCTFADDEADPTVLCVIVTGTFDHQGHWLHEVVASELVEASPRAVVLDLEQLDYTGDDDLALPLELCGRVAPTAIVVSQRCVVALTTLLAQIMDEDPRRWIYWTRSDALAGLPAV